MTIPIGHVDPAVLQLLKVTEECLYKGIEQAVAGNHLATSGMPFNPMPNHSVTALSAIM